MRWFATEILEESSSDDEDGSDAGSGSSDDSDSDNGQLFLMCLGIVWSELTLISS